MKKYLNRNVKDSLTRGVQKCRDIGREILWGTDAGIDGILVTVGLCIIALLLCVVMKDSLAGFITTIVEAMTTKADTILNGTVSVGGV